MKNDFLLHAIGQTKEDYIMEAQQLRDGVKTPRQTRRKPALWKGILIAAMISLMTVTAYAADFLNIQSLTSGTLHFSSSSYKKADNAMKIAGFQMDLKEQFGNGYTFDNIRVEDVDGRDEQDQKVLTYKETSVTYRNQSGYRLYLHAYQKLEEIPQSDHAAAQSRVIGDVTANYYLDHYKIVPADYQLTEADKLWEQQPGNFISYGSDQVEKTDVSFVCWEKEGICYSIMDMTAKETPDTLFSMAAELMGN